MKRFFLLFILTVISSSCFARRAFIGLRDAEIEQFLEKTTAPIFEKAGLDSDSISVHLISSSIPNAFVTNGQNMYIHAGLFLMADHENEIAGVLAHETGHIKGGHLARMKNHFKDTQTTAIAGMALGLLAILGGGETAPVGLALMMGTNNFATKNILSYSRNEERMADEIGLQLLEKTNNSAQGFLTFMNKLGDRQKILVGKNKFQYYMSHPLTKDRKSYLSERMSENSKLNKKLKPPSEEFKWVKAKTTGYFNSSAINVNYQKNSDYKLYAKTFAFLKNKRFKSALIPIKKLVKKYPKNGFFHETHGQVLFGAGQIKKSMMAYQKALRFTNDSPLIQMEFVAVALENKNANLDELKTKLSVLLMEDSSLIYAHKLLAIIYGKQEKIGLKFYSLAEYEFARGKKEIAKKNIALAEKKIDKNSIEYLKLMDLKTALKKKK